MKRAHGLNRYFYEYLYHRAVEQARAQNGAVIPISSAKAIRARVDELLGANGSSLADPRLGPRAALGAMDAALLEAVPDYEPRYGAATYADNYGQDLAAFTSITGLGPTQPPQGAMLPISPYDPRWADRASVRAGGTELSWIADADIQAATEGVVADLHTPDLGDLELLGLDPGRGVRPRGPAMTGDDASGLTLLMDKMSAREYAQVRNWVLDGARDPRSGEHRFMSPQALARSVAVLDELKAQGQTYEVLRDREPGQIKARLSGSGMEVRLIDPVNEAYAGARIYDNGTVVRYSTNQRVAGGMAVHSPTPAQAVDLLRFAQGQPLERKDVPGTMVGALGTTRREVVRGRTMEVPDAYHGPGESMFVVDDLPGSDPRMDAKLMLRRDSKHRSLPALFRQDEAATIYLQEAVASARENMYNALDVEALINHADDQLMRSGGRIEETTAPTYSADPEIAAIQRTYWDVLTGVRSELLRPGATEEMYRAKLEEIGELGPDENPDLGNLAYGGAPEEKVRQHAEDVPFELIGTFEPQLHQVEGQWVDQRFDPVRVARYMTSPAGQWSNMDSLASALRRLQVHPDQMMGTGFQTNRFKDRLITFDATTAVDIGEHASPFIQQVGAIVRQALEQNATAVDSIKIDDAGVIQWSGGKQGRNGQRLPVTGQIGQVFDVGDYGEVVTSFASGNNALIVPGYQARIAAQRPDQSRRSVEERTILRGYPQLLEERIRYQVALDLNSGRSEVGEPASLNTLYSQLQGTRHPVDFIEANSQLDAATGTPVLDPWAATILETEAARVRYDNQIRDGSTIFAAHEAKRGDRDLADDNHFDAWALTGGRNMAVLTGTDEHGLAAPEGYFDPVMTGGAANQGIVRYLTQDARVRADGTIEPGDTSTAAGRRAALMNRPELATLAYDPFDRQQMTASTIMQSSKVTEPTNTALMTFGGWTADDPMVVSAQFAARHQIRGAGGALRPLVVGDKLSDLHGNKGVISLVVDRDMNEEAAAAAGLSQEVAWFRANPDMDVVMSPFSLISRRNAGSAREMMAAQTSDLVSPTGQVTPAGLGQLRFVVTHMAVDEKTKVYDTEQVRAGKGRKASSQLAWAIQSQDCPAIMAEFYGHNSGAEANLREYLLVSGIDMEVDGTLRMIGDGQASDERPERRLIEMPELVYAKAREGARPGLNVTVMRKDFGELIGDRGGDLELPFPLRFPTGEQTVAASDSTYRLPVLSSHLRSGQEFEDGSVVTHDYTRSYQEIFVEACRYRDVQASLDEPGLSQEDRVDLERKAALAKNRAQRSFESITTDVGQRVLTGKNNIFKNGIMSSRLADSATMVWSSDPRLDIDQIALSSSKAAALGLKENDHALVWRDPILRDAGVRYLRVAINDELTGVAINPVMGKSFDGDFDGDAVAVVKLHTRAAHLEAMQKLSVPANLVDRGIGKEDGGHPLSMHVSLDTQVALSKNPELEAWLEEMHQTANITEAEAPDTDPGTTWEHNAVLTDDLSDFYRSAQRTEFGSALTFADAASHVASVREVCVATGAKGNEAKLGDYARYLGLQINADGSPGTKDLGVPGITQADQEASMYAQATKTQGTGLAGAFSQRAVAALRQAGALQPVLEMTYPVTQSVLQAKHDAAEAEHKYEMLRGPGRDLWRGREIERTGPSSWRTVMEDGVPKQATRERWSEQMVHFYRSKEGFGVDINPEHVDTVAAALTDPGTGLVRNLEESPELAGTVLDRLAYGKEFSAIVAVAKKRMSLYEDPSSAQFAPAGTRASLRVADQQLAQLEADVPGPVFEPLPVSASAVKADVVADTEQARTRGASRRSTMAVGVGRSAPVYVPSISIEDTETTQTQEMEL